MPMHNLIAMSGMVAAPKKAATVATSVAMKAAVLDRGQYGSVSSQRSKGLAPIASAILPLQPQLLPRICCCCSGDIAEKKAVLLQCECVLAFCLECARRQLFETMRDKSIGTGVGDFLSVYCPGCKQRPVVGNELKGSNLVAASIPVAEAAEQSLVRFCV